MAFELTERGAKISFEAITNLILKCNPEMRTWEKMLDPNFSYVGIYRAENEHSDPITKIVLSDTPVQACKLSYNS